jgi:tetratricopeptide (TPR) repeat protein
MQNTTLDYRSKFPILLLVFVLFASVQCASSRSSFERSVPLSDSRPTEDSEFSGSSSIYHYLMGEIASEQQRSTDAYRHFRSASDLDPQSDFLKLKQAEILVGLGRMAEASLVLESVESREDPNFFLLRSRAHSSNLNLEESLNDIGMAIQLFESQQNERGARETSLLKVALLSDAQEFDRALEFLEIYLEAHPDDEVAMYFQGKIHSVRDDLDQAVLSYQKALEINPHFVTAAKSLGLIHELREEFDLAIEVYAKVLSYQTDDLELREKVINLLISREQYERALPHIDFLSLYYPNNIQNILRAGLVYFKLDRFKEAEDLFARLLNQSMVDQDRVRFYLGALFEQQGDFSKSIEYFTSVTLESRYFVDSQLQIAKIQFENLKNSEAASASLLEAIRIRPDAREFYLTLASYYDSSGRTADAVRVLHQSTQVFQKDEELLFVLGTYLDRSGDFEAGIRSMREVLLVNPNNAFALNHIGYVFAERKINLEEAEQLLLRAVQLEPQNPYIIDSLGWLYHQSGKYSKSKEVLERAIQIAPLEPEIIEHLADVYGKLGRTEEALELYHKAVSLVLEEENSKNESTPNSSNPQATKRNERILEKIAIISSTVEQDL